MYNNAMRYFPIVLILILMTSGCGFDTGSAYGNHLKEKNTIQAQNVVSGRVAFPGAMIKSISMCGATTFNQDIGSDGSFAIHDLNCPGPGPNDNLVTTSFFNGATLYSVWSGTPIYYTDIITTTKDNWYGVSNETVEVPGNTKPVYVTRLTDWAYLHNATNAQVNSFLINKLATPGFEYVANPFLPDAITTTALNVLPKVFSLTVSNAAIAAGDTITFDWSATSDDTLLYINTIDSLTGATPIASKSSFGATSDSIDCTRSGTTLTCGPTSSDITAFIGTTPVYVIAKASLATPVQTLQDTLSIQITLP